MAIIFLLLCSQKFCKRTNHAAAARNERINYSIIFEIYCLMLNKLYFYDLANALTYFALSLEMFFLLLAGPSQDVFLLPHIPYEGKGVV